MSIPINIILIEDHPEYRETIELALSKESDIEIIGQFGTAEAAMHSRQITGRVDLILLDLNLPGISGLDFMKHLQQLAPNAKIIILTQSSQEEDILKAIMLGASGYLLKSARLRNITEGIRTVAKGGTSLDSNVAKFIIDTLKTKLPANSANPLLTDREMEVLQLLADGLVKKEIARRLQISVTTVVTHVNHIYEKLNVKNAPSAISKSFRLGILPMDD